MFLCTYYEDVDTFIGEEIMEKDARMSLLHAYLQQVFQNGRQKWVSFFFDHPVFLQHH